LETISTPKWRTSWTFLKVPSLINHSSLGGAVVLSYLAYFTKEMEIDTLLINSISRMEEKLYLPLLA